MLTYSKLRDARNYDAIWVIRVYGRVGGYVLLIGDKFHPCNNPRKRGDLWRLNGYDSLRAASRELYLGMPCVTNGRSDDACKERSGRYSIVYAG